MNGRPRTHIRGKCFESRKLSPRNAHLSRVYVLNGRFVPQRISFPSRFESLPECSRIRIAAHGAAAEEASVSVASKSARNRGFRPGWGFQEAQSRLDRFISERCSDPRTQCAYSYRGMCSPLQTALSARAAAPFGNRCRQWEFFRAGWRWLRMKEVKPCHGHDDSSGACPPSAQS